jgi:asparagine N-glycosylation enzyme membrane subunit Stt3
MDNPYRAMGLGFLALVVIAVLYYVWPYLVSFLAIVGAGHLLQLWRNRQR